MLERGGKENWRERARRERLIETPLNVKEMLTYFYFLKSANFEDVLRYGF
jgi:hypothetical protein